MRVVRLRPMLAFTLVELLIAISIIVLLAAMLLPLVASARERARRNETTAFLNLIAGAIERFKDETDHYPLPTGDRAEPFRDASITGWYPSDSEGWGKQHLWWRLATAPDPARRIAAKEAIQLHWQSINFFAAPEWPGFNAATDADVQVFQGKLSAAISNAEAEAYRHPSCGDGWTQPTSTPDFRARGLAPRGWAKHRLMNVRGLRARTAITRAWTTLDVLGLDDIKDHQRNGDTLLDTWGSPIGYIHRHQPAVQGGSWGGLVLEIRLDPATRATLTDRNGDGVVNADELLHASPPAEALVDHNEDGVIDANDWGSWHHNALPGYEQGFLLVSAGPDGAYHPRFSEVVNRDNVLVRGGER